MLLIFTTCILLLAGISLAILLKRLSVQKLLVEEESPAVIGAESYRPLFAPTDEELRIAEADERKRLSAKQEEARRQESEEKLADLDRFRQSWAEEPSRAATIDLLYRTSQTQNGTAYLETCEAVVRAWQNAGIADVAAGDLAQLLETHFWILPAAERTPGSSFRLRELITAVRE